MIFIDTDIAVAMRDVEPETHRLLAELSEIPVVSMITRIELENGVNVEPAGTNLRRQRLERFLRSVSVEMFTHADILAYGQIVYDIGYDRRTTLDRLIAAQAIARDASLITRNGRDFKRIEKLHLIVWPPLTPHPPSEAPR